MSVLAETNVLRPRARGLKGFMASAVLASAPHAFAVLRKVWPLPKFGKMTLALLHDDVREVFGTDAVFQAPYHQKLETITGNQPFFLGLNDGPEYRQRLGAMQAVVTPADLPGIGDKFQAHAEAILANANGSIEVVDKLVRQVTFDVLGAYLGVPKPPIGELKVWATRLFEFQFVAQGMDLDLLQEVNVFAPALRAHVQGEIERRKAGGQFGDDIMGRCLALQANGALGYSDAEMRTNIVCLFVGGPPQPPMVVPQALEQLLRRPSGLAGAQAAARNGNDELLRSYIMEAIRFDPLAPGLPRNVAEDGVIAKGTTRERTVSAGETVLACFASAMMDPRRLPSPGNFDPHRLNYEYINFGYGLHECFGRHINHATLHRMLKPLLIRTSLKRAPGRAGHLVKNGAFAESLNVTFD